MRKRMRDRDRDLEPERERGEPLVTYGRPSVSSWVAAAAVAFAFFVLGGFIKTYRQLEDLQEESRREIDNLEDSVRMLRSRLETGMAEAPQSYRVQPLPPPRRSERDVQNDRDIRNDRASALPAGAPRMPDPGLLSEFERYGAAEEADFRPRVQFGRRSNEASRQLLTSSGTPCQVVSVSGVNKRLMIEGGRDVSLAEGARLELCRDGRWIGDLRVVDVFDNQSSCEVLHVTAAPEPGDTVRLPQR